MINHPNRSKKSDDTSGSIVDINLAKKVLEVVDAGLVNGVGKSPDRCAFEAAVCYAMGLPHGDEPTCVSRAIRRLMPERASPCVTCGGSGELPDDDFEQKLREATAKIGMVYFIRDDVNQRIKIGSSLNPLDRIRQLQTGSSVPLRLMAMCGGGRRVELHFHETFKERRIAGEWFNDRDREITRIVLWSFNTESAIVWPSKT